MENKQNLWGGRFTESADGKFASFNRSFDFDKRLFKSDVRGCLGHLAGLRKAKVLSATEADAIENALHEISAQAESDLNFMQNSTVEDVHSFIETKLIERIGDTAKKLHQGRSRNDQVATAFRLWLRDGIDELQTVLTDAQTALIELAEKHKQAVLPGYTHLQRAQPVLFAHWCLAYFEMLRRDAIRLEAARKSANVMPLGAAALAGTSVAIDREFVARTLGFADVSRNSLDAVSDRDFAVEFLAAAALIAVHLSRFAEDVILYATAEFGFFELSDRIATGSSLMPQKKNPDSLELVRGKSGRVFGHLFGLLTVLKGLPLAYNKDLQEDKESIFDAFDTTRDCLQITAIVLRNLTLREDKTQLAAQNGYLNATELADYLAAKNVPFRQAHETAGKIVLRAIELKVELNEMPLAEMQKFAAQIEPDVYESLSLEQTLASKNVIGGTAPAQVAKALETARSLLIELTSR